MTADKYYTCTYIEVFWKSAGRTHMYICMYNNYIFHCIACNTCTGFKSCPGQTCARGSSFFLGKVTALGVLCCLVVCLTLLASFFLPSHLPLKHVHVCSIYCSTVHTCTCTYILVHVYSFTFLSHTLFLLAY